jgi:N-acetylmuramoyl-L-alanine amidase
MNRTARINHGTLAALFGGALLLGHGGLASARTVHPQPATHHAAAHNNSRSHAGAQAAKTRPRTVAVSNRHAPAAAGTRVAARSRPAVNAPPPAAPAAPLIVIDPGHGGRDPGAIGAGGTQEKVVTLAIALELRNALKASGRYRVAMTRSSDQTVSLSDRLAFARDHDADLLIAIHADASPDRRARGASVYVSSGQGVSHLAASSGNSARIAQALSGPDNRSGGGSNSLQQTMIDQLADDVHMVVSPARAGHLYVLGSRSIPSVLLETGFISNKQEEAQLNQPAHRHRLVGAIRDAIDDYFRGVKAAPQT